MNSIASVPERLHSPKSPVTLRTVIADEAGQRIDNFLMRLFKTVPRSRVYRLVRKGEVRVNRKRVDAEYRIQEGDEVRQGVQPPRAAAVIAANALSRADRDPRSLRDKLRGDGPAKTLARGRHEDALVAQSEVHR